MCPNMERYTNRETWPMGLVHIFYNYAFGFAMDTPQNAGFHRVQHLIRYDPYCWNLEASYSMVQVLGNFYSHSLIWVENSKQ